MSEDLHVIKFSFLAPDSPNNMIYQFSNNLKYIFNSLCINYINDSSVQGASLGLYYILYIIYNVERWDFILDSFMCATLPSTSYILENEFLMPLSALSARVVDISHHMGLCISYFPCPLQNLYKNSTRNMIGMLHKNNLEFSN